MNFHIPSPRLKRGEALVNNLWYIQLCKIPKYNTAVYNGKVYPKVLNWGKGFG